MLSAILVVVWLILNASLVLKDKWRQMIGKEKNNDENEAEAIALKLGDADPNDLDVDKLTGAQQSFLLRTKGPFIKLFCQNGSNGKHFGSRWVHWEYLWINSTILLRNRDFIYRILYLSVAIFGMVASEVVYCLLLFEVINRFPTLKTVTKAISFNYKQLLYTLLFAIIVIYFYAFLGFHVIDDNYYYPVSGGNQCTTLALCFITHLYSGPRKEGGMADIMLPQTYADHNKARYFLRYFFDVSWFLLLNIMTLNLVFGIIVGAFA